MVGTAQERLCPPYMPGLYVPAFDMDHADRRYRVAIAEMHRDIVGISFGAGDEGQAWQLRRAETEARALPSKITLPLQPGDVVSVQTPGGGGCAPVWKRPLALVAADVAAGKISIARARQVYGVVVHPDTYMVDEAATAALRTSLEPI